MRHPGLEEFFKRYKYSDLVPAVEVKGVSDWYEDQLNIAVRALERITACCMTCTVCGSCEAKEALDKIRA